MDAPDPTTTFPAPTASAVAGSTPTGPTPAASPPSRQRSGAHIAALVIGCLLLLPGLGLVAGGGFALIGQVVATDDDGYFEFTLDRLESNGVAVAATDIQLGVEAEAPDWILDRLDVDVRLRVDGAADTDDVFVGIARSADVDRYLAGSAYDDLVELDGRSPRYTPVAGRSSIASPLDQDFWVAEASGSGVQELTWEVRTGRWSVVVMNADGTANVQADTEVGARFGILTPVAITILVAGGILLAVGVTLVVVGARGREVPTDPASPAAGGRGPLDPPSPGGTPPTTAPTTVGPTDDRSGSNHSAEPPVPVG